MRVLQSFEGVGPRAIHVLGQEGTVAGHREGARVALLVGEIELAIGRREAVRERFVRGLVVIGHGLLRADGAEPGGSASGCAAGAAAEASKRQRSRAAL